MRQIKNTVKRVLCSMWGIILDIDNKDKKRKSSFFRNINSKNKQDNKHEPNHLDINQLKDENLKSSNHNTSNENISEEKKSQMTCSFRKSEFTR